MISEKLVEHAESEYIIYQSVVENGLPIFIALFLGPWTDKFGNKPVIILTLFGYLISSCLYICAYFLPQFPPAYILLCSVPIAITGGGPGFVISTFGYLIKQSDIEDRSSRLAILGIAWDLGGLVGCLSGAKVEQGNS
jgi:PCFT/HCP family folate transporter-like MFS transporter 1/3